MTATRSDDSSVMTFRTWGHVTAFAVPDGYQLPEDPGDEEGLRRYLRDRQAWDSWSRANTTTVFGKDYFIRFPTKCTDREGSGPFFTTTTADADDFLTKIAVGDGAVVAPDPNAFTVAADTIERFRGFGTVIKTFNLPTTQLAHAVQMEFAIDAENVTPSIVGGNPFNMNEAAIVTNNSVLGSHVVAYCTFPNDEVPIPGNARIGMRWTLGVV